MTTPIKVGDLSPARQRLVYSYDPERGDSKTEVFENCSEPQMFALLRQYRSARVPYECVLEGDYCTLTIQDPTGEYVTDTWQIENDELSPSALTNPLTRAAIDAETVIDPDIILEAIGKVLGGDPATISGTAYDYDSLKALFTTNGLNVSKRLMERMKLGGTSYYKARPSVRHTTNCSNRYTNNVAFDDTESILTPAAFATEAQNSSLWIFPMPQLMLNALLAVPVPAVQTGYLWGYLKRPSTFASNAQSRVDINTVYLLDQWSTDEYAEA